MTTIYAKRALCPDGWAAEVAIDVSSDGRIARVGRGGASTSGLLLLPGIPNCHSHAFQRALAGRTERAGHGRGTFLSWREQVYALCRRVSPDAMEALATLVYVEMLQAGYTSVCEFHYLHHGPDGKPHDDPAAASRSLIRAARTAGIRITLLPVLYMQAGFGAQPPERGQAPFIHTVRDYLALLEVLLREQDEQIHIVIAFHSLRAVSPEAMAEVLAWRAATAPGMRVHIHVAEQLQEVRECQAWTGRRPVAWLLEQRFVDEYWCLVHATHMTEDEAHGLAATGAVACLCPTTEANLGDGIFPLPGYLANGGLIAIGSDSQVSVSPVEELRWLEYCQRLILGKRNICASPAEPHTGARLVRAALAGGGRALGQGAGLIAAGHVADFIGLDANHPLLDGDEDDGLLDRFVFSGNRPLVRDVIVAGRTVVHGGHHPLYREAAAGFSATVRRLDLAR